MLGEPLPERNIPKKEEILKFFIFKQAHRGMINIYKIHLLILKPRGNAHFVSRTLILASHALRPMYVFQMINLHCNGDSPIGVRFYISVNIQDVAYHLNL